MPLLAALVPFLPLITKLIDINDDKHKNDKTLPEAVTDAVKGSTIITEGAQVVYGVTLFGVVQTLMTCNETLTLASLSCVTGDQWAYLAAGVGIVYGRLKTKVA